METSTVTHLQLKKERQGQSGQCCICSKKTSRLLRADGRGGVVKGWNVTELIETYGGLKITTGCICISCRSCVLAIHARVLRFRTICAKSPLSKISNADSDKVSGSTSKSMQLVNLDNTNVTKLVQKQKSRAAGSLETPTFGTSEETTSSTPNVSVHFVKIDNAAVQKQKCLSKYRSLAPKPAGKESDVSVEIVKSPRQETGQSNCDHTPESRPSCAAGSKLSKGASSATGSKLGKGASSATPKMGRSEKVTSSAPDIPVQFVKIENPAVAQFLEKQWKFIPVSPDKFDSVMSPWQDVAGAESKPTNQTSQSGSSLSTEDASSGKSPAEVYKNDEQQSTELGRSEAHNDHTYNTPMKSSEEVMLQYVSAWSKSNITNKEDRLNSMYINTLVSRTVEGSFSGLAKTIMGIRPLREKIITCLMGELNSAVCMLSGRKVYGISCLRPAGLSEKSTFNWDVVIREMDKFMPEMLQLCLAILHNPDTQETNVDKLFKEYKPKIGMVYSILLQGRIKELSKVQRTISTLLRNCGCITKVVFNKLQPMGVCLSYTTSLLLFKKLTRNKTKAKEEDNVTNPSIVSDAEAKKPESSKVVSTTAKPPIQAEKKRKLSHPSKSDSKSKKKRVSVAPVPSSIAQEMKNLLPVSEQQDPLLTAVSDILQEMSDM